MKCVQFKGDCTCKVVKLYGVIYLCESKNLWIFLSVLIMCWYEAATTDLLPYLYVMLQRCTRHLILHSKIPNNYAWWVLTLFLFSHITSVPFIILLCYLSRTYNFVKLANSNSIMVLNRAFCNIYLIRLVVRNALLVQHSPKYRRISINCHCI